MENDTQNENIDSVTNDEQETTHEETQESTEEQSTEESTEDTQEEESTEEEKVSKKDYVKERRKRMALEAKLKEQGGEDGSSSLTKEEGKLYARIYNSKDIPDEIADDVVERVHKIAQLDDLSLEEAYKSEDFQYWKDGALRKYQEKQAQLGASRGSRGSRKKTLDTPGLSQEEHKALWREKMGS